MDLIEQNELAEEIDKLLTIKLTGRDYHVIVAVEGKSDKFALALSTLNEKTAFKSCSVIVTGIAEEAKMLSDKFKIPSDEKLKKPIEPQ